VSASGIASFRCAAEFSRDRGIAGIDQAASIRHPADQRKSLVARPADAFGYRFIDPTGSMTQQEWRPRVHIYMCHICRTVDPFRERVLTCRTVDVF
jgi:hypothetical protein